MSCGSTPEPRSIAQAVWPNWHMAILVAGLDGRQQDRWTNGGSTASPAMALPEYSMPGERLGRQPRGPTRGRPRHRSDWHARNACRT